MMHQLTTFVWPQCYGMVEHLIKTIKHGFTVKATINIQNWDSLLPQILFGYWCGIQADTKYFPFMVLTSRTPILTIDNSLNGLCDVFDEHVGPKVMAN